MWSNTILSWSISAAFCTWYKPRKILFSIHLVDETINQTSHTFLNKKQSAAGFLLHSSCLSWKGRSKMFLWWSSLKCCILFTKQILQCLMYSALWLGKSVYEGAATPEKKTKQTIKPNQTQKPTQNNKKNPQPNLHYSCVYSFWQRFIGSYCFSIITSQLISEKAKLLLTGMLVNCISKLGGFIWL